MKDPILPVGKCPVVEMVPRSLYEESKQQTADAMVLVSDLRQNLAEMGEKLSSETSFGAFLNEHLEIRTKIARQAIKQRDDLQFNNTILKITVLVLISVILVLV